MTTMFQTDAYNRTAESVADEFCRSYWQEPRKRSKLDSEGRFKLRGGLATYQVRLDSEARPAVFVVERLPDMYCVYGV